MANSTLHPELYEAARTGNVEFFKPLLSEANLNTELHADREVVIEIVSGTHAGHATDDPEADDVLVANPVQPADRLSGVNYAGDTVLHIAAHFRETTLAQEICEARTSFLMTVNNKKETPLHYAVQTGNIDLVQYFIGHASKKGNNLNLGVLLRKQNTKGETALYQAVQHHREDVFKELIQADPDLVTIVTITDNQNISPLYLATVLRSLPVVTCLTQRMPNDVSQGAYSGPDGRTALHAAALYQENSFFEMILRWKPELAKSIDDSGHTPLHCAALLNNYSNARILLESDITSAYTADKLGYYPLHLAARLGHIEVVKELFKQCPDSHELLEKNGRNFLHLAVSEKRVNVIKWVNKNKNAVELEKAMKAVDGQGNTPLHLAVKAGDPSTLFRLLLSKRVHLNCVNKDKETPLDIAFAQRKSGFSGFQDPDYIIYSTLQAIGCSLHKYSLAIYNFEQKHDEEKERKEMKSCESMAKNLSIGSVLIASATFAAAITVSGVYNGNRKELYNKPNSKFLFEAFYLMDAYSFLCALIATILLVDTLHGKRRKGYLSYCASLVMIAAKCFITAFAAAAYLILAPDATWIAILIYFMCVTCILAFLIHPRSSNLLAYATIIRYRGCTGLFVVLSKWPPLLGNLIYMLTCVLLMCGTLMIVFSIMPTTRDCYSTNRYCASMFWVFAFIYLLVISWDLLACILIERILKPKNLVRKSMV